METPNIINELVGKNNDFVKVQDKYFMTKFKVKWNEDSTDDFTFEHENYCLRAEKMDEDRWWWCVYYGEDEIASDTLLNIFAATELEAKLLCEVHFLRHISLSLQIHKTSNCLPEIDFNVICYDKFEKAFIGHLTHEKDWQIRFSDGKKVPFSDIKKWCEIPH